MKRYKKELCVMAVIALAMTGCGAQTDNTQVSESVSTAEMIETSAETATATEETQTETEETITETVDSEETIVEEEEDDELIPFDEDDDYYFDPEFDYELEEETLAAETTVETVAEVTESDEDTYVNPCANHNHEAPILFFDNPDPWDVEKTVTDEHTVLTAKMDYCTLEAKIKMRESWELTSLEPVVYDELPYAGGGLKAEIIAPEYKINLMLSAETSHYDDIFETVCSFEYDGPPIEDDLPKAMKEMGAEMTELSTDEDDTSSERIMYDISEKRSDWSYGYSCLWTKHTDNKHFVCADAGMVIGPGDDFFYQIEVEGDISNEEFEELYRELLTGFRLRAGV